MLAEDALKLLQEAKGFRVSALEVATCVSLVAEDLTSEDFSGVSKGIFPRFWC